MAKRMGRPRVEGEPRSIALRIWVTEKTLLRIETARGTQNRSDWIREQIEKGLQ